MGSDKIVLPLLPLRDIIVFPFMVLPLFVGRDKSNSILNFNSLCNLIEMGGIVSLSDMYPIKTYNSKSYYSTSKPIKIEGTNLKPGIYFYEFIGSDEFFNGTLIKK